MNRNPDDYRKFQEQIFTELDALESENAQRAIGQLVEAGRRVGIDVIAEILDHGKELKDVVKQIEDSSGGHH